MKRRDFLGAATVGAAATLAAPALAQGTIRWRMVSAWPRNLPGPGVAAQMLADRITTLSGGRIQIELFAAGEVVPGLGVFDAVGEGTADIYHAVPAYWGSKSQGILLFGSQPLGLNAIEQHGWMLHGGGQALYDEMYARFNLKPFLCGNSGPQWAGWFRREVNTLDDLRGLKYRTTGLNSVVMSRLGVAVEAMSGPAMFQALQSGALDAGEFIGPWTDSGLGFQQVAPFYYDNGVGEPSSAEECAINLDSWNALPDDLKQAVSLAAESLYNAVLTEYNTRHAMALRELVAGGTQVKSWPEEIIIAMGNTMGTVLEEMRADSDPLVVQITQSFLDYRALMADYMVHSEAAQLAARALPFAYPR
jgi:TRAP-type mannitol/chloroaromatic compound transport system substrate-binding protein